MTIRKTTIGLIIAGALVVIGLAACTAGDETVPAPLIPGTARATEPAPPASEHLCLSLTTDERFPRGSLIEYPTPLSSDPSVEVNVRRVTTGETIAVSTGTLTGAMCSKGQEPAPTAVTLNTAAALVDFDESTLATLSAGFRLERLAEMRGLGWYVRTPRSQDGWISSHFGMTVVPVSTRELGSVFVDLCHPLSGEDMKSRFTLRTVPAGGKDGRVRVYVGTLPKPDTEPVYVGAAGPTRDRDDWSMMTPYAVLKLAVC